MEEANELGEWKKLLTLGSGAFGIVTLWRHTPTNECVAIKKCRRDASTIRAKERTRWIQEVDFMKTVKHPNIVSYKTLPSDFLESLEQFNLSRLPLLPMEYCSGGNLRILLKQAQNACGLREADVRCVLNDISQAVSHLHRLKITHRDIKPENVVIQARMNQPKVYKLIDLGYAKDMNLMASFVGTLAYTAPEIFRNEDYNHNVDYWSFGCMAYEISCGKHPFIPQVIPFERFELISQKEPRDICVYKSQENKIIYTDKILEPNHISRCFRTHLEDWLGTMLEYKSSERGKTKNGANVFTVLQNILKKTILHIFSVYNYANFYYEIDMATKLSNLQLLIQRDTGLKVEQQLIIISSLIPQTPNNNSPMDYKYIADNPNALLLTDLGLSSKSVLIVFKRYEFISGEKLTLPPAVLNLLQARTGEIPWNYLYVQTNEAVHFIERELNNMKSMLRAIANFSEHVRTLMVQDGILSSLRLEAERMLHLVDICKEVNSVCIYDRSKQEAIKLYRKCLWRARELIENVNSATVRWLKMKSRAQLLRISYEKFIKWLKEFNFDTILQEAIECLNINKQKGSISAQNIAVVICNCLKLRDKIQKDKMVTQNVGLCFKMLREIDKLTRWINALKGEIQSASMRLLEAQKTLSQTNNFSYSTAITPTSSSETSLNLVNRNDCEMMELPPVDDLISDNRVLRYNIQEVLSGLLLAHKQHALNVEEYVNFINDISTVNGIEH